MSQITLPIIAYIQSQVFHEEESQQEEAKTTTPKDEVKLEEKEHLKPKQKYLCEQCQKNFQKQSKLTRHINETHKNIKNFKCDVCEKEFKRAQHLKRHYSIHSGEKPFACNFKDCPMKFSCKHHLTRHVQLIHLQVNLYKCDLCEKEYRKRKKLIYHKEVKHQVKAVRKVKKAIQKKKTKKSSFYMCTVEGCLRMFTRMRYVNLHRRHVHDGIKDFGCPKCEKRYSYKHSLQQHMKSHEQIKNE